MTFQVTATRSNERIEVFPIWQHIDRSDPTTFPPIGHFVMTCNEENASLWQGRYREGMSLNGYTHWCFVRIGPPRT